MKRVALISLGCAKNLVDSEVMLGCLAGSGYGFVEDPKKADVIIINTCGFIRPARDEALAAIRRAVRLKKKKSSLRIVAAGCFVEKDRDELGRRFPQVDAWTGVKSFDKIVPIVQGRPFEESQRTFLYDETSPRILSTPPAWAYLKISEGCSHGCSFCTIPLIKGTYRSRGIGSIVREARALAERGVLEINLISQDSTYFGRDRGRTKGIAGLLGRLIGVPKIEWIRVLYGYPEEITPPLLDVMKETKICSYLDIPFQHADSRLVRAMKRGLDGPGALRLLEKIRAKIPDIAVRTSLIVGFPGEGKKEFRALKRFVREAVFDHLGVFTYSPEPGTAAFAMPGAVSEEEKRARRDEIMEIQAGISFSRNKHYVGRTIDVLLEGPSKKPRGPWLGRGRFQAPEVDGLVFVDVPPEQSPFPGIARVEITKADVYDLHGRMTA